MPVVKGNKPKPPTKHSESFEIRTYIFFRPVVRRQDLQSQLLSFTNEEFHYRHFFLPVVRRGELQSDSDCSFNPVRNQDIHFFSACSQKGRAVVTQLLFILPCSKSGHTFFFDLQSEGERCSRIMTVHSTLFEIRTHIFFRPVVRRQDLQSQLLSFTNEEFHYRHFFFVCSQKGRVVVRQ